jgi:ribonuclease G
LRLRNLSGIILIDFINMENPDHQQELFYVLKNLLKKDPVKSKVIDITPLHILEMTRKKVRRPVFEDLRELETKTGL